LILLLSQVPLWERKIKTSKSTEEVAKCKVDLALVSQAAKFYQYERHVEVLRAAFETL
jgi:hypothetical protein